MFSTTVANRDVVAKISPPPPPGAPPQYVLAAVLAERHRRSLARLQPPAPVPVGPPAHWGQPTVAAPVDRPSGPGEFAPPS